MVLKTKKHLTKNKFYLLFSLVVFSLFGFSNVQPVKAEIIKTDVTGYAWAGSTNDAGTATLGWIDLSTLKIPLSGKVTWYAWSDNVGWIDFDSEDNCTTGTPSSTQYKAASCTAPNGTSGGVFRNSNTSLNGWARIVSIAQASAAGNAGGWGGWISIGSNGNDVINISAIDGNMSGYAWSEEFGWIDFAGDGVHPGHAVVPPIVTLNPSAAIIFNVATTTFPKTVTLTWSASSATSCSASSSAGTWNNGNIDVSYPALLSHNITVPATGMNETFTVSCTGPGGTDSKSTTISTVCYPLGCSAQKCVDNSGTSHTQFGVSDVSTCSQYDTCKFNADCEKRTSQSWQEVAPK